MVKVNVDLSKAQQKLSNANMDRGRYAVATQALADMNPYVPKKENPLREATNVSRDGTEILYNMPYAKPQFYGFVGKGGYPVTNYTTPGTGRRWDLRAKSKHMKDWEKAYVKGAGLD